MADKIRLLREPDFIPTKWLIMAFIGFLSILGGIIHLVLLYSDIQGRLEAQERQSLINVDEYRYQRSLQQKDIEWKQSIDRRLGRIEGKVGLFR